MTISGELFIGEERVSTEESFRAVNTTLAQCIEPAFSVAGATHAAAACELAWSAFDRFRNLDAGLRAGFLETIAAQILTVGDELLMRAQAEIKVSHEFRLGPSTVACERRVSGRLVGLSDWEFCCQ